MTNIREETLKRITRLQEMAGLKTLSRFQAMEAVELMDKVALAYIRASKHGNKVRNAAREVEETRDRIAKEYDLCTCCYSPTVVCDCGPEDWLASLTHDNFADDDILAWDGWPGGNVK